MKPLNILYSYPLRIGVTGVGMTSYNLVKALIEEGHNVYVCAASLEKPLSNVRQVLETFKIFNFRLPIKPLGTVLAAQFHDWKTARYLRSTNVHFDVVHCWPLCATYTVRQAKKRNIPSFLERPNCHTEYAFEVVQQEYERLGLEQKKSDTHSFNRKHLIRELVEYSLADYICCPSEFVAETFKQRGISEEKLEIYHYGYDASAFNVTENPSNDDLVIAFVGRCEPRKGLHYALDAWLASDALNNGTFYILGRFDKEYKEHLKDKLTHQSVVQAGYVEDVAGFLKKCDALILPSLEEGSALVTYEASACGCLLLVSEAAGAQAVHNQNSLIHSTGDVDRLKEHINMLVHDPELKRRLKRNNLSSSANFTWQKAGEKLTAMYERHRRKNNAEGATLNFF